MSYSLSTLWHERQRYLPGVLAVAFSALLIALQCGLLFGLFSITSLPIDNSDADVWIGASAVKSVDLGRPMLDSYEARVAAQPGVERTESYLQGFGYWTRPDGGTELCMIVGCSLEKDAIGRVKNPQLDALYHKLAEPGTVVVDESDADRLGIKGLGENGDGVGANAEITGQRVRVVGLTKGLKSLAGPYVFCSRSTARPRLRLLPEQITYVLAKCSSEEDAKLLVGRLEEEYALNGSTPKVYPFADIWEWFGFKPYENPKARVTAYTKTQFSMQSQYYWLTKTKAGIAMGYAAALGLLVGAVVTSQTLYAATVASLREFAVLRALGIPRWRMSMLVLAQSFWIGIIGVSIALPAIYGLAQVADHLGVKVALNQSLLIGAGGITLVMALFSGLFALRSLRQVEPATLLR